MKIKATREPQDIELHTASASKSFVGVPVTCNGKQVGTVIAAWIEDNPDRLYAQMEVDVPVLEADLGDISESLDDLYLVSAESGIVVNEAMLYSFDIIEPATLNCSKQGGDIA